MCVPICKSIIIYVAETVVKILFKSIRVTKDTDARRRQEQLPFRHLKREEKHKHHCLLCIHTI